MYNFLPSWFFDASGTFTCPVTGTYQVICVGKGGDGGDGQGLFAVTSSTDWICCGTGGGAGGVAIYLGELQASQTYPITISDTSTNFNNGWLIANAGGNGEEGLRRHRPTGSDRTANLSGGAGGSCSGTHVTAQYPGFSGEDYTGTLTYTDVIEPRKGGSCSIYLSNPGINGKAGVGVMYGSVINGTSSSASADGVIRAECGIAYGAMYGGGGMGGGCAAHYNSRASSGSARNGTGGKGGPAICLISFIE